MGASPRAPFGGSSRDEAARKRTAQERSPILRSRRLMVLVELTVEPSASLAESVTA